MKKKREQDLGHVKDDEEEEEEVLKRKKEEEERRKNAAKKKTGVASLSSLNWKKKKTGFE